MSITSYNPSTHEVVGTIETTELNAIPDMVAAARAAQNEWAQCDRSAALLRAREYLLEHIDALADIICAETGKPRSEAISAELFPIADLLYYYATQGPKILRTHAVSTGIMRFLGRSSKLYYDPLGAVAVIAPWNYPFAIPAGTIAMALLAGNAVVFKSSENTPLVGQALTAMFQAVLPPGVLQHVVGAGDAGQALCTSEIDKVFFTGSVAVGKSIMRDCAARLTPCQLELGGKDAMIVRADADIDQASSGAVWGAFTNTGQVCASVERCYVHADIADAFIAAVVYKTRQLRLGDTTMSEYDVGPVINEAQLARIQTQVDEARTQGATVHCGGQRSAQHKGFHFEPTVLTEVDAHMTVMREETFGPILPIQVVQDDAEAIRLANDSPFGLTASVWSRDHSAAQAIARQLKVGTCTINETTYTHAICQTPWGGRGDSGFGRTHGRSGLLEMVHPHHVHTHACHSKSPWWYPYSTQVADAFVTLTKKASAGMMRAAGALPSLLRLLRRPKL